MKEEDKEAMKEEGKEAKEKNNETKKEENTKAEIKEEHKKEDALQSLNCPATKLYIIAHSAGGWLCSDICKKYSSHVIRQLY